MGYLRKNSFMIFSDEGAPTEDRKLDPKEIAEIEAKHQEGKKRRADELILQEIGRRVPEVKKTYRSEKVSMPDRDGPKDPERDRAARAEAAEEAAKAKAEQAAAEAKRAEKVKAKAAGPEGDTLRQIVQSVQSFEGDRTAFTAFLSGDIDMKRRDNFDLRAFAWKVFEIETSKAKLPDNRYVPHRSAESTVRFKDDHRLGINEIGRQVKWVDGDQVSMTQSEKDQDQNPALWVKVADGAWAKDGNWGGHLQITCATQEGKWIGTKRAWLTPVSSKAQPVAFYDMGNYYEIWEKDRESGWALVVEGDHLRFIQNADRPGKFQIADSIWD
ncbi:hypothetical protein SAMN05216532_0458 [Streptomyces sp. 2231.1]|uniref:hypothetical protein n=1 Tax=Streptomyces sp. 2231.1 TaxID=1855347 RepID=UPI00089C2E73|nr:hypothetical protein [Streptomyces sp. 2231.1]SEC09648.1 hypothetical protein SAMN05216532_0458 [Streptomyces sp. 2231.1]